MDIIYNYYYYSIRYYNMEISLRFEHIDFSNVCPEPNTHVYAEHPLLVRANDKS